MQNKSFQSGFSAIIVAVIAGLIVAGIVAGYQYVWLPKQQELNPQKLPSAEEKATLTPETPTPTPKDETADWKTYKNEEYAYEIKYPKDWFIYTQSPLDVFIQPTKEEPGSIPGPHADAFELKVKPVASNLTLLQAIQWRLDEIKKAGIDFTQENAKIGGNNGLKIKTVCEGVGCGVPEWFIINSSYLYHFNSNLGYSNIFDKMLSTFKFIEVEVQSYTACGCGCCGGVEPTVKCLYRSKGDNIQKIIEEDKKQAQSPICPTAGCSMPIKYIYCD